AEAHVAPEMKVLDVGQLAAVEVMQTPVWALQHAPVGPQFTEAQVVLANHEVGQAAWVVREQAVRLQQAPVGTQGLAAQATLEVQVRPLVQFDWMSETQPPADEQQEPVRLGLGHGLVLQEPAK